jgi:hypothetical protein
MVERLQAGARQRNPASDKTRSSLRLHEMGSAPSNMNTDANAPSSKACFTSAIVRQIRNAPSERSARRKTSFISSIAYPTAFISARSSER